jgi:hypothetical protein
LEENPVHRPRKPTIADRITLVQEARVFLEPDADAPAGSWRRVQILVPQSPEVFIGIDRKPTALGLDRNYKVPLFPPGAQITLALLPGQFLMGMSGSGFALVSIVVEYFGGE